jgi:uncharacterized membrane-anchored protein YhcB (DUF1043 family)
MNTREQKTINDVQTVQAVMKEHQKAMQKDLDELKTAFNSSTKEINTKLDTITSTLDAITAGRKVLIFLQSKWP